MWDTCRVRWTLPVAIHMQSLVVITKFDIVLLFACAKVGLYVDKMPLIVSRPVPQ